MSRLIEPRRIEVVDDRIAAILRAKSPTERLALAFNAHAHGIETIVFNTRTRHPEWDDARVRAETAWRLEQRATA
jgi:hypothetical protein